jgi:O-antigen/teichoic acid export membrane protein
MSFHRSLRWSFLAELASRTIQPATLLILARLLTPTDFGVVAAAAMLVSFAHIFWDAGLGKALIRYGGDLNTAANTAFWINIALGIVCATIVIGSSEWIATEIFRDARVAPVLTVLALQILLTALASIHTALLQKDMQFRELFWVRLITVSLPAAVSIPLAWNGYGYWALVVASVVGQAIQAALLWKICSWRPAVQFSAAVAKEIAPFGMWVSITGLLSWFYVWADSLIVGIYLGADDLGRYRTGSQFVTLIFGVLFSPLLPVLYAHLSRLNDAQLIVAAQLRTVRAMTFVAVPLAFLLYAVAEPLTSVVLGPHWAGTGAVVAVLALAHGFSWIISANGEMYRAIGRPELEPRVMAWTLLVYLAGYWLSVRHGLEAFLWTRLGLALCGVVLHLWVASIAVRLPFVSTLAYAAKLSACCAPAIVLPRMLVSDGQGVGATLVVYASVAAAWIGASLWLLERKTLIPQMLSLMRGPRAA